MKFPEITKPIEVARAINKIKKPLSRIYKKSPSRSRLLDDVSKYLLLPEGTRITLLDLAMAGKLEEWSFRMVLNDPDTISEFSHEMCRPGNLVPADLTKKESTQLTKAVLKVLKPKDKTVTTKSLARALAMNHELSLTTKCIGSNCPRYSECTEADPGGPCKLRAEMVDQVCMALQGGDNASLQSVLRTELLLRPLMDMITILQLEISSGQHAATYEYRGTIKANPVYKELRDTLLVFDKVMTSITQNRAIEDTLSNQDRAEKISYYQALLSAAGGMSK